ncbi:protein tweety [Bacillus rossius redtenbacheri]|uniref:protein tweety n=1 Tax=Bacillus rossius redtenbacheri TaxID=93214 RepID=UPI002FDE875D
MIAPASPASPPPLALILHSFPHLNISLHLVNSTFEPRSTVYLESLGILGSLPAAWLILTLLVLLIYLLTRCCDHKPRPKRSITALKWTLAIFALLCCAAVGAGLYGNDDVHNGLEQFLVAAQSLEDHVQSVRNQTDVIEATLQQKILPLLTELGDVFDNPVANQTARGMLLAALTSVLNNTSLALTCTRDISRPIHGISLGDFLSLVQASETIRWPVTMAVLSVLLVFCVVLLFGVARHSRCALITFSVFGLFAVIVSWLMASLYLAAAVAAGDLCVAPDGYLQRQAGSALRADILTYYMHCDDSHTNPFNQRWLQGKGALKAMGSSLAVVSRLALRLYNPVDLNPKLDVVTTEVKHADGLMSALATLLDCKAFHKQYGRAVDSVCDLGLFGLSFMLLAAVAAGVFFTVLVWVDSHTWIYIRKRRDYLQVDEQDPFLPPSAASQAIAARTLRSQGSYGSTGLFRSHHTPSPPATLDGRGAREEKSQHGPHHESAGGGGPEFGSGTSAMLGPNHGQYATLSKQCKTLESSDFY